MLFILCMPRQQMASNQPGASLDDVVSDDALVLMERTWADLTSYTGAFQDSLNHRISCVQ